MIDTLKKNIKKITIYLSILIILLISMCFSSFIDKGIINLLSNKNHIIANDKLLVHFINVGQADAVAINFPNGKIALIDTGSEYSANDLVLYLNTYVMPLGHNKIDYLFFSHADSDHTGGISTLLFNYKVNNIIRPRQYARFEDFSGEYDSYFEDESGAFDKTMADVYDEVEKGCALTKAEDLLHFDEGDVDIDIFYPNVKASDSNSASYFIKIAYEDNSLLFTGDVGVKMEEELVKLYGDKIDCNILKVAHHGSDTSTSSMFLSSVTPDYAVISVGKNSYGHPSSKVVNRLKEVGAKVLRTDLEEFIMFSIGEKIDLKLNSVYISKIEFSYFQLAWCVVFIMICNGTYWLIKKFKLFRVKVNKI